MRLKHSIDNGFMEMFRVQPMTPAAGDEEADSMQCRGCGCKLGSIPVLPGARKMVALGVASSLAPDNRRVEALIQADETVRQDTTFDLLFDPQTCGGLLLGVDEENCQRFIEACQQSGFPAPVRIGQVTNQTDSKRPITVNP